MLILWGSPIFRGGGGHKKTIYMENYLKRGAWRKIGKVFLKGGGGVDTLMHTITILVHGGT